jgi:hypothetical protein
VQQRRAALAEQITQEPFESREGRRGGQAHPISLESVRRTRVNDDEVVWTAGAARERGQSSERAVVPDGTVRALAAG